MAWMAVAVGCGGDSTGKPGSEGEQNDGTAAGNQDEDETDADDSAGDGDATGECSPAAAPAVAPYDGEKIWTAADVAACDQTCADSTDPQCILTSCAPGGQEFANCVQVEVYACLSGGTSPCRADFGAQYCCGVAKCDLNNEADADKLQACLEADCAPEREAFTECANGQLEQCLTIAGSNCVVEGDTPDEGAPEDAEATQNLSLIQVQSLDLSSALLSRGLRELLRVELQQ